MLMRFVANIGMNVRGLHIYRTGGDWLAWLLFAFIKDAQPRFEMEFTTYVYKEN